MSLFPDHVWSLLRTRPGAAVRAAISRPGTALKYVRRNSSSRWLSRFFTSRAEYDGYAAELAHSGLLPEMKRRLTERFAALAGTTGRGNRYTPGHLPERQAQLLYALLRKLQPGTVVETGVCNGFSTAVQLEALRRSGTPGRLYSIDYPEFTGARSQTQTFWEGKGGAVVPEELESGWLVPGALRDRWTLRLGKSADLLPPLLAELDRIDIFFHDSEHSYQNQMFEFSAAFARLKPGGVIVASDINWSDAFDDFCLGVRRQARWYFVDHSLALLVKENLS